MPIYLLECKTCNCQFDKFMSIAEMELIDDGAKDYCPACKRKRKLRVMPAKTGVPILKDGGVGGFYHPTKVEPE